MIHRDIKPGNIMVRQDGHATLLDFGLVLVLGSPGLTRVGTIMGTPEYMSPEQSEGNPVTAATDIYSLGIVTYEMVAGRPRSRQRTIWRCCTSTSTTHRHRHAATTPRCPWRLNRQCCGRLRSGPSSAGQTRGASRKRSRGFWGHPWVWQEEEATEDAHASTGPARKARRTETRSPNDSDRRRAAPCRRTPRRRGVRPSTG